MDVEHIEWMMPAAKSVCDKENIDEELLMPLVILHDVGYSQIDLANPFHKNVRQFHMIEGAKLAQQILEKQNFIQDKLEKVVKLIATHDVWALGNNEIFKENKVLGCFNDLDFIWMVTEIGFINVAQYLKLTPVEMLKYVRSNEKITNRPFCTETTAELYEYYLIERTRSV